MSIELRRLGGYGWRPSLPDRRDLRYGAPLPIIQELPPLVDLEPTLPPAPAYDQLNLSSCVGNASALAYRHGWYRETGADFDPSRLWIYWQARNVEGSASVDAGCYIRDAFRVLGTLGAAPEPDWPYIADNVATPPPASAYPDAAAHLALQYLGVAQDPTQIRACLAEGHGIVLGMMVFPAFETVDVAASGVVPMPAASEDPIGAHAVYCIGYDDALRRYKLRNSWGPGWGLRGCFYLDYDYVHDAGLVSDLWTIRLVTRPGFTPTLTPDAAPLQ